MQRGRGTRLLAVLAALLILAVGQFDAIAFALPHRDRPARSDVIVAIGGGNNPGRLDLALDLMASGYAPRLVTDIPDAQDRGDCKRPGISCIHPLPFSTQGEARAVAALAATQHWGSVLLVVSTDQVTRARIRFGRCYRGVLRVVSVSTNSKSYHLLYENAALIKAELWQRAC